MTKVSIHTLKPSKGVIGARTHELYQVRSGKSRPAFKNKKLAEIAKRAYLKGKAGRLRPSRTGKSRIDRISRLLMMDK